MSTYPQWTKPTLSTNCVRRGINNHPDRPTVPGTDLCGPCHTTFTRTLADILEWWPALQRAVMKRPDNDNVGMPSGSGGTKPDLGSYWNPAATLVIADITDWAGFLHRTIIRERGDLNWTGWAYEDGEDPRITLATIVKWHARWLTHHPALGAALAADAQRLHYGMQKALDSKPMQRRTLEGHTCRKVVSADDNWTQYCEGQLYSVLDPDGGRESRVLCGNHPDHIVLPHEWIHLV